MQRPFLHDRSAATAEAAIGLTSAGGMAREGSIAWTSVARRALAFLRSL